MSACKKSSVGRISLYRILKKEGVFLRICIAAVFVGIFAGVMFLDIPIMQNIKEGLAGGFKYDMQLFDAGGKVQEMLGGDEVNDQWASGGTQVLKALKKPLKNAEILKSFSRADGTVSLRAGQLLSVYAVADGKVIKADKSTVIIEHEDNLISYYSGCDARYIKEGDKVTAGQMIGGLAPERDVLEFALKKCGEYVDPQMYIDIRGW